MKVIICGAGIAGLALARLLTHAGWDCLVVEQRPQERRGGGYMIDFFGAGFDSAEAMGLLPRLRQLAYPVEELTYVNRRGQPVAGLSYRLLTRAVGGRLLSLMRGDMEMALYEGLCGRVRLRYACTVSAIDQSLGQVAVTLSDGSQHRADLLVGADGIHSRVRELVFGPESGCLRYLGIHAAAYTFADPPLHQRLAGRFVMTDSVDRLLGLYGIRHGRVAVLAVHRSQEQAVPPDPCAALSQLYAGLGWVTPEALRHCPDTASLYYDQVAQIEMPTWSRGRVTLVGDACQAVSLLAGQGTSLAVAGAHILASELARSHDVSDALVRYQARMLPVIRRKQAAGRRTAEWFLPPSRTRLLARHLALRLMRAPGIGRRIGSALVGGTHPDRRALG
jgi:2-polyprenyl-6-methoxyphenol hydroxylase-like FAD-dependent oxidoreductase